MIKRMWFALLAACLFASVAYAETANTLELPANLKTIKEEAYYQASSIGEVIIPEGVTEIGPRAFAYSGLTKINLPATLVDIASDAFEGCGYFTAQVVSGTAAHDFCVDQGIPVEATGVSTPVSDFEYWVSEYTTEYGTIIQEAYIYAYNGTNPVVQIPSRIEGMSVTSFGSAFRGNTAVQTVIIPRNIKSIASNAFVGCTNLTSVYFPGELEQIGDSAFEGCTALRLVDFPEASFIYDEDDYFRGSLSIGSAAFKDCDSLESISIHRTIDYGNLNSWWWDSISLGSSCFEGCDNLKSVELISERNTTWGPGINLSDSVFKNCKNLRSVSLSDDVSLGVSAFENCVSLETFPVYVGSVGNSAFKGCVSLKAIALYNGDITIGESAFEGCTSLTSVQRGGGEITFGSTYAYGSIGKNAFAGCTNLAELNIGDSISEIGEDAFSGCIGIEHIMLPDACTTIGEDAFAGCNLRATVYAGSPAETYMQANNIPYDVVSDRFNISIMEGSTCSVTSYLGDNLDIIVPEHFGPYTVTKLGRYLFDYEYEEIQTINSLVLPDTITEIGFNALGYHYLSLPLIFHAGSTTYHTLYDYYLSEGSYSHFFFRSPSYPDLVITNTTSDGVECLNIDDYEGNDTTVTIPNEIDGFSVKYIATDSGYTWNGVTELFIEPGVCTDNGYNIWYGAFSQCKTLEKVTYLGNVPQIGSYTFSKCPALKSIIVMGKADAVGANFCADSTALESVVFNGDVGSIGSSAFSGCAELKNLVFNGDVDSIGSSAFSGCTELKTLVFNGDVGSIGSKAFRECSSLTGLILPSGNPTLGESAFANTGLHTITIPDGWTTLPSKVFYQTTLPDKVMIPNSVTSIADDAFGYIYSWDNTPVIYCNEYSYAQTWANSKDLPVVLMNGNTFADYGSIIVPESLSLAADTETTIGAQVFPYDAALTPEWSSSAPEIASVDQNGKVTAHAQGEAVITVSAGGVSSEIAVNVYLPITDFTLSDSEITVTAGSTAQLSILSFTPAESSASFLWSSDNELMATVDETGLVSALSIGDAVITCASENGLSHSCTVHIVAPE